MKNVLIVSPYYPPGPTACAHRARHLAKHLGSWNWRPVILCVDERFLEEGLDDGLVTLTSRDVEVVKCSAVPARYVRPFGIGEITLRAWFDMRRKIARLMQARPFDAVLFTGSHFYSMLHASMVRKRFGVPVVLDFQDPWVSAWGAMQPRLSKAGTAHQVASLLEPKAVAAADFITSVSETQNAEMRSRYPHLTPDHMAAIPIGGDPEDYDAVRANPRSDSLVLDPSRVNLSYVGTLWPPVLDTIRALLLALAEVRTRHPHLYARLRLNFIGTTRHPHAPDGHWVRPLAEAVGVADAVLEEPRRLPYMEALSLQARSDAILILGSAEPHYTASKIYGIMMSGRPYLSVFHEASNSHEILSRAGGGIALSFDGAEALSGIVRPLAEAIIRIATTPETLGRADPAVYAEFTASEIARRYGEIFTRLADRTRTAS